MVKEEKKENKKFSKFIVIFSILTVLAYTAIVLYFSWHNKIVPSELTLSFFGIFGIELASLAGIKIKEVAEHCRHPYFPHPEDYTPFPEEGRGFDDHLFLGEDEQEFDEHLFK